MDKKNICIKRILYPNGFAIRQLYSLLSSVCGTMLFSTFFAQSQNYSISYAFLIGDVVITVILYIYLNKQFMLKKQKERI